MTQYICKFLEFLLHLTLSSPGGLRGPDNQIHSCHSQTCYPSFIIKTCSDQILAILVNQEVAAALFSSGHLKKFENEKIFLCLKIAEIDMGANFGSKRMILDIKTHFLEVKPIFRCQQWLLNNIFYVPK